ncbi:MAG: Ig-like domain-containing protein, partial [Oceanipulchritudo sp.]
MGSLTAARAHGERPARYKSDPGNLEAILVDDVDHGTLSLNSDGSFDYDNDPDFVGTDSFTYRPNDGTDDGNI